MISRHLIKMLLGLVGMGLFGIICLVLINLYYKETVVEVNTSSVPAASRADCGIRC